MQIIRSLEHGNAMLIIMEVQMCMILKKMELTHGDVPDGILKVGYIVIHHPLLHSLSILDGQEHIYCCLKPTKLLL